MVNCKINVQLYIEILVLDNTLWEVDVRHFPANDYVFQDENVPLHPDRIVQAFMDENQIVHMD